MNTLLRHFVTLNAGAPIFADDTTSDYKKLLGEEAWNRLNPAIQARFSKCAATETVTYKGIMRVVYLSKVGTVLAQLCRLIGTPLALHNGTDIDMEVSVYPDKKRGGFVWDRRYFYANHAANRVKSTKCIQKNVGLIECVGGGFGMYLHAYEAQGSLHFESTRYFWEIGSFKIPLPDMLTPGKTEVMQQDLGNGLFRFFLRVTHRYFGEIFLQDGEFYQYEKRVTDNE